MIKRISFALSVQLGLCLILSATSVIAGITLEPPAVGVDPVLIWMQAAGFPAWAGVVAWGVMKITSEIKDITGKLDAFVIDVEKRLTRLEIRSERKPFDE